VRFLNIEFLAGAVLLSALACRESSAPAPVLAEPFESPRIRAALLEALPQGWSFVETRADQIPWGHHNTGHGGELVVVAGPKAVAFLWRDGAETWHEEPLAQESLELWIMPAMYRPAPRPANEHHPHIPAKEIFEGRTTRVYGKIAHVISAPDRFEALLEQATSTGWSDISDESISWRGWKRDLASHLKTYDDVVQ
jgi:hypothetical protein